MTQRPSTPRRPRNLARAFNLVEMLIALAISASLLTATLQALDASWRGYRQVSESASSHVVTRIVIHRVLAMVRTGTNFSPFPADVLDSAQNPMVSTSIQFQSDEDRRAGNGRLTRLERRSPTANAGEFELWYVLLDGTQNPPALLEERPLLRNVRECSFILEYEPGPRLLRATVDLTVQPNDDRDVQVNIGTELPTIRMVASAVPRQLQ
jgi:prepilin-type N-terminal cleavage/methylation domain-containing protein